jgi:acetyl-CoA carboxylase carboxyl transferase subunit beta
VTQTTSPYLTRPPDWVLCPGCRQLVYNRRLADNLNVCPDCGSHHRLTARKRLAQLLDEGSVELFDVTVEMNDPLQFVDSRPYPDRWRTVRLATGLPEAVLVARGRIAGTPVIAAVMDFRFLGGSLGAAVGELITLAAETALAQRTPLLLVTASGGARMQEGALSLMQLAKTSQALGQLDRAGVLTISLVTDPTYGGVAASFATLPDVIVAEPGARLGFAGPRVIAQTIRQTLPPGFQTAELLLGQGQVDVICPRHRLRQLLGRLLAAGAPAVRPPAGPQPAGPQLAEVQPAGPPPAGPPPAGPQSAGPPLVGPPLVGPQSVGPQSVESAGPPLADVLLTDPAQLPAVPAWEAVQRARNLGRPTTLDYLSRVFDDFEELRGDRISGDCAAVVGGVAQLAGRPVMVIGHQKGHTPAELTARNYGMPRPAGYRKAARLARLAAKLGLPVITLVDTPGAYPGVEAEEQGQAIAIAELLRLLASLPVPVLSVVTGEGGSGGALALAVADQVFVCANGTYSVISPEGCAAILWNDPAAAPRAAAALRVDARSLLAAGIVDGVVPEPPGGSHTDHVLAAELLAAALVRTLRQLSATEPARLLAARHNRFRRYGADLVSVREDRDDDE